MIVAWFRCMGERSDQQECMIPKKNNYSDSKRVFVQTHHLFTEAGCAMSASHRREPASQTMLLQSSLPYVWDYGTIALSPTFL